MCDDGLAQQRLRSDVLGWGLSVSFASKGCSLRSKDCSLYRSLLNSLLKGFAPVSINVCAFSLCAVSTCSRHSFVIASYWRFSLPPRFGTSAHCYHQEEHSDSKVST